MPASDAIFLRTVKYAFLAFCLGLLSLAFCPVDLYAGMVAEDGPVETATAIICFAAAVFSFRSFFLRRSLLSRNAWPLILAGLLFFFVGGEEISWGQRLLGLRPVFSGSEANIQREMNIHNLGSLDFYVYFWGFAFIVISTGIIPLLSYFSGRIRLLYKRFGIPLMPVSLCACMWMGFVLYVFLPQIMYGRGSLVTVFYPEMYAVEELREFYFTLVLGTYIFTDYFFLLTVQRPFEPAGLIRGEHDASPPRLSMRESVIPLLRHNAGLILALIILVLLLPPRFELIRRYLRYTDKQALATDPDLIIVEGEHISASNAGYWTKEQTDLFGSGYLAFYADEALNGKEYFFRYRFKVNKTAVYNIYFAGTPPGSRGTTSFRHQHHSPYIVYLDGRKLKDVHMENTEEYLREKDSREYGFYLHYEYADDFYVTGLGRRHLEKGIHTIEFILKRKAVASDQYVFYLDAIVLAPVDWEEPDHLRSLATDIFSH